MSVAEIVANAAQLDREDFEAMFAKLASLRLQRNETTLLSGEETALLSKINKGFSEKRWERLHYLDGKSEFETLTEAEQEELLKLSEAYENYTVQRLKWLVQLAQLRQIPLDVLLKQLGIDAAQHV